MIKWFAQEHPASCVAACVRMVLTAFGQKREESKIRTLLGNPRFGLTLTQAARKLIENGAFAEYFKDWNIDDLRDCLRENSFPIVGIERRFFGHSSATHAVVVVSVKADSIEFLDPLANRNPQTATRETFETAWQSAGLEVLLLQSPFAE